MDEQMALNPWLPEFLQQGLQYAVWLEVLQYLLLIVLAIAVFTLVCAFLDLVLLLRQEYQKTQPLGLSVVKSLTRWLDTHVTHLTVWRAVVTGVEHVRHLRFPH